MRFRLILDTISLLSCTMYILFQEANFVTGAAGGSRIISGIISFVFSVHQEFVILCSWCSHSEIPRSSARMERAPAE